MSIVAQGCFHPVTKVQSASLHFFLGSEEEDDESEDEEVISDILFHDPHFLNLVTDS